MRKRNSASSWLTSSSDQDSQSTHQRENTLMDFGDDMDFEENQQSFPEEQYDDTQNQAQNSATFLDDFDIGNDNDGFTTGGDWHYQAKKKRKKQTPIFKVAGILAAICFCVGLIRSFGNGSNPSSPPLPSGLPSDPPQVTVAEQEILLPTHSTEAPHETQETQETLGTQETQAIIETNPPVVTEPIPEFSLIADQSIYYARSLLTPEEQKYYDIMYETIYYMTDVKALRIPYAVNVDTLSRFIVIDHPELFWYSGSWSGMEWDNGDGTRNMDITFHYNCTQSEREQTQRIVDAYAADCLNGLEYLDEYSQVKAVYEYIIDHTIYDYDYYGQTITEIIVNRRGVCASYARTTQYLLQQLGFEIVTVFGYGHQESHLWNMLKVEGDYYLLDTTWGDPITENDADQTMNYNYFLVTTEVMDRDHRMDDVITLPYCTATSCNYFIREGRYFTYYDKTRFMDLMRTDTMARQDTSMKFSTLEVYHQFISVLSDGNQIYPLLAELGVSGFNADVCSYSYNEEQLTITIHYEFY